MVFIVVYGRLMSFIHDSKYGTTRSFAITYVRKNRWKPCFILILIHCIKVWYFRWLLLLGAPNHHPLSNSRVKRPMRYATLYVSLSWAISTQSHWAHSINCTIMQNCRLLFEQKWSNNRVDPPPPLKIWKLPMLFHSKQLDIVLVKLQPVCGCGPWSGYEMNLKNWIMSPTHIPHYYLIEFSSFNIWHFNAGC